MKLKTALVRIEQEVQRAKQLYPANFHNQHEAYAVILEEIDELWSEIKKKQSDYNLVEQAKEAIQAAAMLVRFLTELIPDEPTELKNNIGEFDLEDTDHENSIILYAFRSCEGMKSDTTFLSVIRPRMQPNGRYCCPSSFVTPVQIQDHILSLRRGQCLPFTLDYLQKLISQNGGISPELDELKCLVF